MQSSRTKALSISPAVKREVFERDGGCCIFCGRRGLPEAHFIPRSQGGLGIKENIFTACRACHHRLDATTERAEMLALAAEYLDELYPNFPDDKRRYHR